MSCLSSEVLFRLPSPKLYVRVSQHTAFQYHQNILFMIVMDVVSLDGRIGYSCDTFDRGPVSFGDGLPSISPTSASHDLGNGSGLSVLGYGGLPFSSCGMLPHTVRTFVQSVVFPILIDLSILVGVGELAPFL